MMATAILMPTALSSPPPVKFTASEFDQMGDMGWFEGRRAVLIDGTILEQGPMNPPHATAVTLVESELRQVFGTGWVIRCQLPLHLDRFNNPLPDFAIVPGSPRDYIGRHPTTAALVVEVSDTTLAFDIVEKLERYAEAGITEYWGVDLTGHRLLVFRDPDLNASSYRSSQAFTASDRISPLAAPGRSVLVKDLLP